MEYVWPVGMSGNYKHVQVITCIARTLYSKFQEKGCDVFSEGLKYFYTKNKYLEPDVIVVCNDTTEMDEGVTGTVHLVIEVKSESTKFHDKCQKKDIYEKCGVDEYWVVDADMECVDVYILTNGKYKKPITYTKVSSIRLQHWPDITVSVADFFKRRNRK